MPASSPIEVLTGFVSADGDAYGAQWAWRSTDTARCSSRYDVGNAVWRVTASSGAR